MSICRDKIIPILIMAAACILYRPHLCQADFVEQMAISAKAISLANTCTADPPGIASIHYNPAGLSKLPEGHTFENGLVIPWLSVTSKFEGDQDWKGIFDQWGPQEGEIHDPFAGSETTNSSGALYIPIYNKKVNFLAAPSIGLAARSPDSRWSFAFTSYAPFGGGLNRKADDPAGYDARTLILQHLIYAAPGASYRVTPTLSLGMSVGLGQTAMMARINQRAPNELVAMTRVLGDATRGLEIPILSELTLPPPWFGGGIGPYDEIASLDFKVRDDFTPNYNLGLLWEPKDWFSYGLVYQSAITANLTGSYNFRYGDDFQRVSAWMGSSPLLLMISGMFDLPTTALAYQSGTMTAVQKFPQRVQTGISFKPIQKLRLLFDVNWSNWSAIKQDNFQTDQKIQLLQTVKMLGYAGGDYNLILQRDLKDTIAWSAGLEYQLDKRVQLRCGYEWRPTSVRSEYADLQYFLPDLHYVGAGAGIKLPHEITVDLALGLMFNPSSKIPDNSSKNFNSTDFFYPIYNPYAGLNYEQETYIYLAGFNLTMPFHSFIEMQKDLMQKQQKAIQDFVEKLKKKF